VSEKRVLAIGEGIAGLLFPSPNAAWHSPGLRKWNWSLLKRMLYELIQKACG